MLDLDTRLAALLAQLDGEDPQTTLGPPPWSAAQCEPWEQRHGHDVRLRCNAERCVVVSNALYGIVEKIVPEMRLRVERLEAAIRTVLADEETGTGWGPDATMAFVLKDALDG